MLCLAFLKTVSCDTVHYLIFLPFMIHLANYDGSEHHGIYKGIRMKTKFGMRQKELRESHTLTNVNKDV